jgi:hypothetical protein
MIKTMFKYSLAFLVAVLCTSVLASIFSTQFVLAGLQGLGIPIPLADRLSMTVADFGILPVIMIAAGLCFLIGFTLAGFLAAKLGGDRRLWFVVAGASALVAELLIMSATLGLMPIPGARSAGGLMAQGVAGAAGGWVFAELTQMWARHCGKHA